MKAIILAAGIGRRMQPLTEHTHKTLLPIAGTTILDRLLGSLRDCDVRDVCIVTGFRADQLRRAVADGFPDLNVEYVHNPQYEVTNNVFSMALALESIAVDDDILLLESDLIVDPRVIEQIVHTPYENAALVDRYQTGMDGTVVSVASDSSITQVHPSYMQDENFDFSDKYKTLNIYKFGKDFTRSTLRQVLSFYSRSVDANCYYELLLGVLVYMRATTIYAETVHDQWAEVDDPNDLMAAEFEFNPQSRQSMLENAWGGYWTMPHTDFAFIRNSYFPTPGIIAELRDNLSSVISNYPSSQKILNRKLSYFERCDEEKIFFLNGASQAYPLLRQVFGGSRVLIPSPTFGEYPRIFPNSATYQDTGSIDWRALTSSAKDADVVVVVNPNNPTGTLVRSDAIMDLATGNPDRVFIVDESFIDFSDQPSILPEVERAGMTNVILLKSLSKCLGVPGLRLGYIHTSHPKVREGLWSETPIWNANSLAERFLEIILKHRNELEASFRQVGADRTQFVAELEAVPVVDRVFQSGANFVLVRLRIGPSETAAMANLLMAEYRTHVKDASDKFQDGNGYLRLAVKRPEDNYGLCELLSAVGVSASPALVTVQD
jgi:histidinol-phosphate/aromatic aminotransferase/cobyric acid decarboxylase-like protein/CTP:molybdopterin cytidylyltransferase MocA